MGKPFTVNINRYDPYKTYRFLVYFGTSTSPVAAVSKVTGLKRSSDVIEYKEGGNAIILKGLGRTKYEPITLERGLTQDLDFADLGQCRAGAGQGLAQHLAEESAQGGTHRPAERGRPAGLALLRASLLGVRVSGAARSRRGRQCHRHRAHQARERGLGAGHLADRAARSFERMLRLPVSGAEVALARTRRDGRHPAAGGVGRSGRGRRRAADAARRRGATMRATGRG